ncbi:hypothetical protein MPER_12085 [Moniliophthora perniciosa FA553]|nr:hypothetical protein MPER_12085 [Moniliophthora perniciosa FA553]
MDTFTLEFISILYSELIKWLDVPGRPTALFQPLNLGPITLQNRIVMSALTRNRAVPTNVSNHVMEEYYRQRAKGGAELIVSEGTLVSQQGTEWEHAPGIWNEEQLKA